MRNGLPGKRTTTNKNSTMMPGSITQTAGGAIKWHGQAHIAATQSARSQLIRLSRDGKTMQQQQPGTRSRKRRRKTHGLQPCRLRWSPHHETIDKEALMTVVQDAFCRGMASTKSAAQELELAINKAEGVWDLVQAPGVVAKSYEAAWAQQL